jgi:hypothetical protein
MKPLEAYTLNLPKHFRLVFMYLQILIEIALTEVDLELKSKMHIFTWMIHILIVKGFH